LVRLLAVPSVVALHLYKGGGLDPFPTVSLVNPAVLGYKSREKLGTLTDSARADRLRHHRGQSGPRTVRPRGRTVRTALFRAQQAANHLLLYFFFLQNHIRTTYYRRSSILPGEAVEFLMHAAYLNACDFPRTYTPHQLETFYYYFSCSLDENIPSTPKHN
jgi:hypothetical protein